MPCTHSSSPGKKALIVTTGGQSVKKFGYLERVGQELDRAGVSHILFDKILPNPVKEHVMEGAALAKASGCDFVVGLGGGSAIDSAKAIAIMAANSGDYWDYINGGSGKGLPVPNDPLAWSLRSQRRPGRVPRPIHGPLSQKQRQMKRSAAATTRHSPFSRLSIPN